MSNKNFIFNLFNFFFYVWFEFDKIFKYFGSVRVCDFQGKYGLDWVQSQKSGFVTSLLYSYTSIKRIR